MIHNSSFNVPLQLGLTSALSMSLDDASSPPAVQLMDEHGAAIGQPALLTFPGVDLSAPDAQAQLAAAVVQLAAAIDGGQLDGNPTISQPDGPVEFHLLGIVNGVARPIVATCVNPAPLPPNPKFYVLKIRAGAAVVQLQMNPMMDELVIEDDQGNRIARGDVRGDGACIRFNVAPPGLNQPLSRFSIV